MSDHKVMLALGSNQMCIRDSDKTANLKPPRSKSGATKYLGMTG